jgi:hypothetical protein
MGLNDDAERRVEIPTARHFGPRAVGSWRGHPFFNRYED